MGAEGQVEGWTSSHGGRFPNQTRSPEQELSHNKQVENVVGWLEWRVFKRLLVSYFEEIVDEALFFIISLSLFRISDIQNFTIWSYSEEEEENT